VKPSSPRCEAAIHAHNVLSAMPAFLAAFAYVGDVQIESAKILNVSWDFFIR
jgi:hypothetical protein